MAMVTKYQAEVVSVVNAAADIFKVEMKSHSGPFKYQPGQFLHLALTNAFPIIGLISCKVVFNDGQK
ncbi:MAG: hypothetical protein WCK09_15690 [Bacteroidota bacterium]